MYRKYRPLTFADVIGQQHITETLTNQIKNDRVSHAYLFTGSRGTGKTTCAKIFARAVNCTDATDGSPCGQCEVCRALSDAGNMDILEIDAASNNKVDEIREIRERVKYPPVFGKYKVYIIDEVHMLTDSAFNALLKTLEEPPSFVIFILATTEVHKLPATILSRCMRFDFRLVGIPALSERLRLIYDGEGVQYEDAAVSRIAQAGEGSVRDMLSVADMCMARCGGKVTFDGVLDVLGAADRDKIAALFGAIAASDVGGVLRKINELTSLGKSAALIAKDLVGYARDLLAVKTGLSDLVFDTEENKLKLQQQAEGYSAETLIGCVQILSAADADLRYSVSPKTVLETAALRACKLYSLDLAALEARIARLERGMTANPTAAGAPCSGGVASFSAATAGAAERKTAAVSGSEKPQDARSVWGRITTYLREHESMDLYTFAGKHTDYRIDGNTLVVSAEDGAEFLRFSSDETVAALSRALQADGSSLAVRVEKRSADVNIDSEIERIKKLMGKGAQVNIKK